ncbi:MAG: hypothetical protein MJ113_00980 [Lachnospiraceae bacterium]|nr:hypothetical protein [Lachnospiraceae bacterium]
MAYTRYPRPQLVREKFVMLNNGWKLDGQEINLPFCPQSELSGYKGNAGEELTYFRRINLTELYPLFGLEEKNGYDNEKIIRKQLDDKRIYIHFGAVDQRFNLKFDGKRMSCFDNTGYLPSSIDLTEKIVQSGKDFFELEVEVFDDLSHEYPYGKQRKDRGGMWYTPVSGIWQSVWLEIVPTTRINKLDFSYKNGKLILKEEDESVFIMKNKDIFQSGLAMDVSGYKKKSSGVTLADLSIGEELVKAEGKSKSCITIYEPQILSDDNPITKIFFGEAPFYHLRDIKVIKEIETKEKELEIKIDNPKLWTAKEPYLYPVKVECAEDCVVSYFGLREINLDKTLKADENGNVFPLKINGKAEFLHGILDQGYFSKGIYTPEDEKEYEKDIKRLKELGLNTIRKHIKTEPESFYFAADRMGMYVLQDMVNSGEYDFFKDTLLPTVGLKKRKERVKDSKVEKVIDEYLSQETGYPGEEEFNAEFFTGPEKNRRVDAYLAAGVTYDDARKDRFVNFMILTISHLFSHPSIIGFTMFNEGWGQFDSDNLYSLFKELDDTRFLDATSGWFWGKESDVRSEHVYFKNKNLFSKLSKDEESMYSKPCLLSEFGGFTLPCEGHLFNDKHYGYGSCKDSDELTGKIVSTYENMVIPAIKKGLIGSIYTQISDVEDEINGLYTYDREVCKVDKEKMNKLAEAIFNEIRSKE